MASTMEDNTENSEDFNCTICGSSYPNSWELLIHQEMHTEEKLTLGYQCQECGTRFALERQLNRHVLSHSEELKPFKCKDCPSRFRLQEHLDVHTRKHNADRPFVCEQCGYRYEQKTHLMSHMKSHTDERPYVCDICHSAFKRSYDMKVHRSTHTEEKPFHCDICGSDFKKLAYLTKHKKTHTTDRFTCNQCGAIFKEKRALVGHVRLHSRDKSKSFVCHICEENFPTSKQLHAHVKIHPERAAPPATASHPPNNLEEKKYHCYQCGCSFSTNNPYQLHKSLQHEGETPYQCQFCTAAFTQDMYLTVHTLKHVEKKIFCDRCKTYCKSEYEMGVHEWQHVVDQREAVAAAMENGAANSENADESQSGDGESYPKDGNESSCSGGTGVATTDAEPYKPAEQKRYNCEHCGCLFNLLKPLQLHKKLQHEGQTPFECHWCTAAFTEENFLKVHIYKHLEKKVTCPRCKVACRSEYELGIHECHEVVEQLRYHCSNCGCSFPTPNPFLLHKTLQHEGVAPYACRYCKATFTQEKFLNVHLYKHAAKNITCTKCSTVCASEYEMGLHEWHHVVLDKLNTTVQPTASSAFDNGDITITEVNEIEPPASMSLPILANEELSITVVYTDDKNKPSPEPSPNAPGPSRPRREATKKPKSYAEPETPSLEAILSSYHKELQQTKMAKRYHCDNCGCSFSFPKPYQLHMSLQHDGETPFACHWCSAEFTKEMFLNVHIYKHLEKQITCRVCRKVCDSEYEMGLHEWEHEVDLVEASASTSPRECRMLENSEIEITPVVPTFPRGRFNLKKKEVKKRGRPKKATVLESPTSHVMVHAPQLAEKLLPKRRGRPPKTVEMVLEPEIIYEFPDNPYEATSPDALEPEYVPVEAIVTTPKRRGRLSKSAEEPLEEGEVRLLNEDLDISDDSGVRRRKSFDVVETDTTVKYGRGQRNQWRHRRTDTEPESHQIQMDADTPNTSRRRGRPPKRKPEPTPEPEEITIKVEPFDLDLESEEEVITARIASPTEAPDYPNVVKRRGRPRKIKKEAPITAELSDTQSDLQAAPASQEVAEPATTRKRGRRKSSLHDSESAVNPAPMTLRRSSRHSKDASEKSDFQPCVIKIRKLSKNGGTFYETADQGLSRAKREATSDCDDTNQEESGYDFKNDAEESVQDQTYQLGDDKTPRDSIDDETNSEDCDYDQTYQEEDVDDQTNREEGYDGTAYQEEGLPNDTYQEEDTDDETHQEEDVDGQTNQEEEGVDDENYQEDGVDDDEEDIDDQTNEDCNYDATYPEEGVDERKEYDS